MVAAQGTVTKTLVIDTVTNTSLATTPLDAGGATFSEPTPCVVHVAADINPSTIGGLGPLTNTSLLLQCGAPCNIALVPTQVVPTTGWGALVFTYSVGGATRRLICDMKPGSYQFPPIQQIKVGLLLTKSSGTHTVAQFAPLTVATTVVPGTFPTPTRPIYTVGFAAQPASANTLTVAIPPGARWVDAWASGIASGSFVVGDATAPILVLRSGDGAPDSALVTRDYTTGFFSPPWGPVELDYGGGSRSLTLLNRGITLTCDAFVRFFLET